MTLGSHRPIVWRRLLVLAGFGLAAMTSASCFKAQAKTTGPGPIPLSVPEPPGRLAIPVEAEAPPPPAATEKPATPNTPATRARPTPTPAPTPPPTPPPSSPPETTTPPVVQTGDQAGHEARAKDKLAEAERNIGRVQRESLGQKAKEQFDAAQKFIRMTRDAQTARNYVFAAYCADKAATLAALLAKR